MKNKSCFVYSQTKEYRSKVKTTETCYEIANDDGKFVMDAEPMAEFLSKIIALNFVDLLEVIGGGCMRITTRPATENDSAKHYQLIDILREYTELHF
jgi:hypothetical protein